jgi:hypothetical protein
MTSNKSAMQISLGAFFVAGASSLATIGLIVSSSHEIRIDQRDGTSNEYRVDEQLIQDFQECHDDVLEAQYSEDGTFTISCDTTAPTPELGD